MVMMIMSIHMTTTLLSLSFYMSSCGIKYSIWDVSS